MQGWIFLREMWWNSCETTFFGTKITHPISQSYSDKPLHRSTNNMKKKNKHNQEVIDIEQASFNPLVFITSGEMAPECRVNKRLAEKCKEP